MLSVLLCFFFFVIVYLTMQAVVFMLMLNRLDCTAFLLRAGWWPWWGRLAVGKALYWQPLVESFRSELQLAAVQQSLIGLMA